MKKCICKVVFKDGQTMSIQVERFDTIWKTEFNAFDGLENIMYKIDEIIFLKDI